MPITYPNLYLTKLPSAFPAWTGEIKPGDLPPICQNVSDGGGRLVALWGRDARAEERGFVLHVAMINETGLVCLQVPLSPDKPVYPDISQIFPTADRMQRALYDMLGVYAQDALDHRKWLRHAAWQNGSFPLRKDFDAAKSRTDELDGYPFVQVEGEGVHEIPVGPVHAGIIEPGHFRFSIVGERVLRLEERLGYVHKGIEKRFESLSLQQGAKLAGRVSGDSTVAYAWAYAMAAENIAGVTPPERALWLRALFLERERVANHLGDLGYLGNDVALAFGFAQFWILKEQVLRNNATLFGHRYLMDKIVPGGVTADLAEASKQIILDECALLEREVRILRDIYEEHAGVQDRFMETGRVEPKLAARLGLCGLAGRASGQAWDMRAQFPYAPYDKLDVQMAGYRNGDVAARVSVRFDELFESLRLQREILANLIHDGDLAAPLEQLPAHGFGIGVVEGWRGEVLVAVHTDVQGSLSRVHPHDPSWQNWPLLEHAIMGNIVPDFPLINKSFNLSYSGQDL
ncbi:MAG TPA: NADH-quinone oxidoreductase subunit C [Gallionella sp.]|nr:NADH-quinone oxidoreductase subunit C [Gallionella sp.]